MTRLNKKICETLDLEIPVEDAECTDVLIVDVEPHEVKLLSVDNPDLPGMDDINHRLLEGEKELDEVIHMTLGNAKVLYEELPDIEPKYRSRNQEAWNVTMGLALDAIKHKTDLQNRKKEVRMKETDFKKAGASKKGEAPTNNFFFGDRETLINMLEGTMEGDSE